MKNESLYKLAGMIFAGGKYTPAEWEKKTGINPANVPGIRLDKGGKCWWTTSAEKRFQVHIKKTKQAWHRLGIDA